MMALVRNISRIQHHTGFNGIIHEFHTSVTQMNKRWRQLNRLPRNPNMFGPLTNLPDYSYADGRPVPFGTRMYNRIQKQREHLKVIKQLTFEVDYAVAKHAEKVASQAEDRRRIIEGKLKSKGDMTIEDTN